MYASNQQAFSASRPNNHSNIPNRQCLQQHQLGQNEPRKYFFPEKCSCPYFGKCQHFIAMKPKGRLQHARDPQLCCNCLGPHKLAYCQSTQTCRTAGCNMKHHTLLHHSNKCTSTARQDITIRIANRRDDAMNCTSTAKTWKSQPSRLATFRNYY